LKFIPGVKIETENANCGGNGSVKFDYNHSVLNYSIINADAMQTILNGTLNQTTQINSLNKGNYIAQFQFANGFMAEENFVIDGSLAVELTNNQNQVIEAGVSTTLEATTNASQVEWTMSDGNVLTGNPVSYTFQNSGTNFVTCVASLNGCVQQNTYPVNVTNPLGIDQVDVKEFNTWYNDGSLMVENLQGKTLNANIEVFNSQGQLLQNNALQLNAGLNSIEMQSFSEQIIFVRIFTPENQQVVKFFNKK
jgi:surface antigen